MSDFVRRIWSDNEGQDIAEYAVMLALIIVVCITAITSLGTNTNKTFTKTSTSFTSAS